MELSVRLYGTLRERFPSYCHSEGQRVVLPDNATVEDLLGALGIARSDVLVVSTNGRILKADDTIRSGDGVNIFQSILGG
ncbi:MAG: MoaD/ThiS family protein [Desulfomonile tiedjei]|uniref:MoaD/ThiS family protein n=1 Tax=Desulfomonile tiedjei TaxID=2358 RepID=A0A9D6Z5Z4_9BACT|nr:MoaD/ThiS family protein [Desulfomonile tiedjei]